MSELDWFVRVDSAELVVLVELVPFVLVWTCRVDLSELYWFVRVDSAELVVRVELVPFVLVCPSWFDLPS